MEIRLAMQSSNSIQSLTSRASSLTLEPSLPPFSRVHLINVSCAKRIKITSCVSEEGTPTESVHFVGIGGVGLSALAMLALKKGWRVSGSDCSWNSRLEVLQREGARVYLGHSEDCFKDEKGTLPNMVVMSSAIGGSNIEIKAARELRLPIYKRDRWLSIITEGYEIIAIAGTHGKSTTTAMLGTTLQSLGDDITAIVGADIPQFPGGGNVAIGSSSRLVLEADEYDHCFLGVSPSIAVVTNIEWEHVDMFKDEMSVRDAFKKFVAQIKPGGTLIVCGDSAACRSLLPTNEHHEALITSEGSCQTLQDEISPYRIMTYGLMEGNDWQALMLGPNTQGGSDYIASYRGKPMTRVTIKLPGVHNVLNSLAVIAVVSALAFDKKSIGGTSYVEMKRAVHAASQCLEQFAGLRRRFEYKGGVNGCEVYDDYAHHPTEIRATLQAARQRFHGQVIWVVFQPHTYSRLAQMLQEFSLSFSAADKVIVMEVYAAREKNVWRISGADLARNIVSPPAMFIPTMDMVLEHLSSEIVAFCNDKHIKDRSVKILTIGAGDVTTLGPRLLEAVSNITISIGADDLTSLNKV